VVGPTGHTQPRSRASLVAGVAAAAVFAIAIFLLIVDGTSSDNNPQRTTTKSTNVTSSLGERAVTVTSTKTEETQPSADRSLIGRAFGNGATPFLFQVLLAGLAAFTIGALVQRILLGEYGITLGPVSLPALPPVTSDSAKEAFDLVTESPEIAPILVPGPRHAQPPPLFQRLDDPHLKLISIRIDLETRLRDLANVAGVDPDVPLPRLPERLVRQGIFSRNTARGITELLAICDRIVVGAEVDSAAAPKLLSESADVLYALDELSQQRAAERQPP
jgi:hypothetical protein